MSLYSPPYSVLSAVLPLAPVLASRTSVAGREFRLCVTTTVPVLESSLASLSLLTQGGGMVSSDGFSLLDIHQETSKLTKLTHIVNACPGGGEPYMAGVRVKENEPIESAIRR